jgi:predicted dehydrogenase
MKPLDTLYTRREFAKTSLLAGSAMALGAPLMGAKGCEEKGRVRTGLIGCGSVSNAYLPVLSECPYVELVSLCDIRPDRAKWQAERFSVPHHYPHIDEMLAGAPFDFLVNLTDMQEHEHLNRQALEAGRHVWSEKPIANSLREGRELLRVATEKGLRLWGAPITVQSPQFAFMARALQRGALGRVAAAHGQYGHEGPDWSAFFYERGGGSLPDLAVYNLTTLTGLLGPAKHVTAMLSIVTPTREILDPGTITAEAEDPAMVDPAREIRSRETITVEAEDNSMVLLDHGDGVISHIQSSFNYFSPHGYHDGSQESRYTVTIVGSGGFMGLVGYDWEPHGVDLATEEQPELVRSSTDAEGYVWELGAALAAECLVTGRELLVTPEHALHVLEVIKAANESQETGRRVALTSSFRWPVVT